MSGFLKGVAYGLVLIAAGWLGGSIYPAPEQITAPIKGRTDELIARVDLSPEALERLQASLSQDEYTQLVEDSSQLAARSGAAVMIERDTEALDSHVDAVEAQQLETLAASVRDDSLFEAALALCPRMTVSNAPASDADGRVEGYVQVVDVNGVALATSPTRGACLSSGFGARNAGVHRGIDLHSDTGGPILAAADGVVLEKKYRDDYGNMLLIDHGNGVYTRYAHLSSFDPGINVGVSVTAGQQVALMGNTAAYRIPVHLHYELLLGDYGNPRGSFGLEARSPFDFPEAL